ncbi:MAG: hypothetical protein QM676_06375 [Novosphingobium sp.]
MNSMTGDFRPTGTKAHGRLIALELNELCPHLLARWMAEGSLPNFKALHEQSDVFVTRADVEEPALLEPWIQWYSVHTGLPYDQHRVFHLTEGKRGGHDDIFRLAMAAGRRVTSFASMNVAPFAREGSVFVGDPWSEDGDASPAELNVYNRFVSHNVREYSNASDRMSAGDYAKFLAFMARHGLSAATVKAIAAQLTGERLQDRQLAWKRVALLDALQFDVFRSYYRALKPDFASFFANSTAHLQHSYWRHMDPEPFTVRPDAAEMALYGDAVKFGYRAMDRLVGRFLKLAKAEGASLMFLTALSQQPFLRYEELGGQNFYRLHDVEAFLKRLGIPFEDVSPTMTHQYLAQFGSPEAARAARARLEGLRLEDGRAVFGFPAVDAEPGALYFGCQVSTRTPAETPVTDGSQARAFGDQAHAFGDLFYRIDAIKSGRHHPDGCLWIQTGRHRVHEAKPSILDVLPTQLDLLGVPAPEGLAGKSLARVLAA